MPLALRTSARADIDLDDHLSTVDFTRIANLISSEVGIKLPPAKRLMVEGRLRKRIRALNRTSFDDYCD